MNKNAAYVRVAIRVRPPEDHNNYRSFISSTSTLNGDVVLVADPTQTGPAREYLFDKFFDSSDNQATVFEEVGRPMCDHFLAGFNATCLAYGQTGAGKTYTMFGVEGGPRGIAYDMIEYVYKSTEKDAASTESQFSISMYLFEMYIDQLRDFNVVLDAPPQTRLSIQAQSQDATGPGLGVMSLASIKAGAGKRRPLYSLKLHRPSSCNDAKERLFQSLSMRQTASTQMNERSSRSHFLMVLGLSQHMKNGLTTSSLLSIVDLAGSERLSKSGSTGTRQNEAIFINKSLSALTHVITSLSLHSPHIPYRDSALTRLLSDSFGGSSFTTVLVMIHPSKANTFETLSSISFGARCKGVVNDVRVTVGRTALSDSDGGEGDGYNTSSPNASTFDGKNGRTGKEGGPRGTIIEDDNNRFGMYDNEGGMYEKQMQLLIREISKVKQRILEEKTKLSKGIGLTEMDGVDDYHESSSGFPGRDGVAGERMPNQQRKGNAMLVQEARKARLNDLKRLLESELDTTSYLLQKLQQREDDYREVTKRSLNDIGMYRISTEEMKLKTLELEYEKSSAIKILNEATEEAERRHKQEETMIDNNNKLILEHNIEPLFKPIAVGEPTQLSQQSYTMKTPRTETTQFRSARSSTTQFPPQQSALTTSRSAIPSHADSSFSSTSRRANTSRRSTSNRCSREKSKRNATDKMPEIDDNELGMYKGNLVGFNTDGCATSDLSLNQNRLSRGQMLTGRGKTQHNDIPWKQMSYIEPKTNRCWTDRMQLSTMTKLNLSDTERVGKPKPPQPHSYSYRGDNIKTINIVQQELKTYRGTLTTVIDNLKNDIHDSKTAILYLSIVCDRSEIPRNIQSTIMAIRRERKLVKVDYDPLPPPNVFRKVVGM